MHLNTPGAPTVCQFCSWLQMSVTQLENTGLELAEKYYQPTHPSHTGCKVGLVIDAALVVLGRYKKL